MILAAGVVLTVLGALVVLGSTGAAGLPSVATLLGIETGGEFAVTIGAVVLILGTLFLVPVILAGVGRLGGHLPTTLRMAARDLARHRSRSAPSVAAVLAAVAGLTFGLTGLASDTEQARRDYLPQTLTGEALVGLLGAAALDAVRAAAPGLVLLENRSFDSGDAMCRGASSRRPSRTDVGFVNVIPRGCTAERTVQDRSGSPAPRPRPPQGPPCMVAGTNAAGTGQVMVLPAAEVVRRLGLDSTQAAAVREGAAVVRGLPPTAVTDGTVTPGPRHLRHRPAGDRGHRPRSRGRTAGGRTGRHPPGGAAEADRADAGVLPGPGDPTPP